MKIKVPLIAVFALLASCSFRSDESVIRREFDIPESAELVSIEVSPKESGWFGREGLKIDAVFQLGDRDFKEYLSRAKRSGQWLPLPIPRDFLMNMFSVKSSKESIVRSYRESGRPLPEEGSVYNPTQEQMLEARIKTLPVTGGNGIFTLKAAGTDIMRAPKKTYKHLDKELNDFMLGILDRDQKRLFIKVSTVY